MTKERKSQSRAFNPHYESPRERVLPGFEHPFDRELDPSNRRVVLAHLIPWDELCGAYYKHVGRRKSGREPLNPRIQLGALIIKYYCNLDDRETVAQISENVYMQYFLGYHSFTSDKPFDASLFVEIRKRFGMDCINAINEKIVQLKTRFEDKSNQKDHPVKTDEPSGAKDKITASVPVDLKEEDLSLSSEEVHKGRLLLDATVCPQDIAYPTDLDLLSEAREISERLLDRIYDKNLHGDKPRTYRETARKEYLKTAQKKKKTKKQIRSAIRKQLGYLHRIVSIH